MGKVPVDLLADPGQLAMQFISDNIRLLLQHVLDALSLALPPTNVVQIDVDLI